MHPALASSPLRGMLGQVGVIKPGGGARACSGFMRLLWPRILRFIIPLGNHASHGGRFWWLVNRVQEEGVGPSLWGQISFLWTPAVENDPTPPTGGSELLLRDCAPSGACVLPFTVLSGPVSLALPSMA